MPDSSGKSWSPVPRRLPPPATSEVTVLTGRNEEQPAALRTGAVIFPLDRRAARRGATVGAEVAMTARLLDILPVGPTVVIVVSPVVAIDPLVGEVVNAACRMLGPDAGPTATLTVGVACPHPVPPGSAGGTSMYNQHLDALPEAVLESIAVARRCGVTTDAGACVLLMQRFAPPTASAVVYASPDRTRPVRIDGRWGLTEANPTDAASDTFLVPADATAGMQERLAWKPTASLTAPGGTRTVRLPVSWRYRYSLSRNTVRQLAGLAREAAAAVGRPLSLDVAMFADAPVVLRCRPCLPA
ncbi:MAG: hypothetical protein ACJ72N_04490 [Labedaea sp.]